MIFLHFVVRHAFKRLGANTVVRIHAMECVVKPSTGDLVEIEDCVHCHNATAPDRETLSVVYSEIVTDSGIRHLSSKDF